MFLGYRDADRRHILENVIFFEFIRIRFDVFIGHIKETENKKIYSQIVENVSDKKTLEREIKPLEIILIR
jgi:hypothetical protein